MQFIVIDTADARGSVAVFRDHSCLSIESHGCAEDYSSWLLPAAQRALSGSGLTLSQLDGYAVCAGPGSFTGLRVGLTTVKAWAELYGMPIAAVSRLHGIATSGPDDMTPDQSFVASIIDARREQVFAALYQRTGLRLAICGEEAVVGLEDFIARVKTTAVAGRAMWRTPDPQILGASPRWQELQAAGHTLHPTLPPFALQLGSIALQKFHAGQVVSSLELDANYVRRSDAEVFWKAHAPAIKL
jgi:tRNA threonylcarbamoyladenosine biosynthesis protein TsaB